MGIQLEAGGQESRDSGCYNGAKEGITPPPGAVQAEGDLTWPRGWEFQVGRQVGLQVGSPNVETDAGGM